LPFSGSDCQQQILEPPGFLSTKDGTALGVVPFFCFLRRAGRDRTTNSEKKLSVEMYGNREKDIRSFFFSGKKQFFFFTITLCYWILVCWCGKIPYCDMLFGEGIISPPHCIWLPFGNSLTSQNIFHSKFHLP